MEVFGFVFLEGRSSTYIFFVEKYFYSEGNISENETKNKNVFEKIRPNLFRTLIGETLKLLKKTHERGLSYFIGWSPGIVKM